MVKPFFEELLCSLTIFRNIIQCSWHFSICHFQLGSLFSRKEAQYRTHAAFTYAKQQLVFCHRQQQNMACIKLYLCHNFMTSCLQYHAHFITVVYLCLSVQLAEHYLNGLLLTFQSNDQAHFDQWSWVQLLTVELQYNGTTIYGIHKIFTTIPWSPSFQFLLNQQSFVLMIRLEKENGHSLFQHSAPKSQQIPILQWLNSQEAHTLKPFLLCLCMTLS